MSSNAKILYILPGRSYYGHFYLKCMFWCTRRTIFNFIMPSSV